MPRNTSVPDARLVRRSQQGDRRAFRALLTRYDWRLRGLAHALLLDPERVDAVLRVAYVRAWREVVRIDPRQNAAVWLYRLVYNACIDGLRRDSTRIGAAPPTAPDVADTVDTADAAEAAEAAVASADPPVEPEPAGANGDRPATTGGRSAQVVEALATLSPADRVAVVLVDREGFAPETAARILGLTPEVLQARVVGARARLTKQLADVLAALSTPAASAEEDEPESPPQGAEHRADEEAQSEAPQPEHEQPEAEDAEAEQLESEDAEAEQLESEQLESEQPEAEHPEAELDDATSVDTAETKVASRSAAGGSPNGSSGAASTNGSDDARGGAS
ncbi:MAG: sigma-70 family RNA polymerase sigma factor [Candidatus Limnocylindrales bacterium]